jgi:hypothetical protein
MGFEWGGAAGGGGAAAEERGDGGSGAGFEEVLEALQVRHGRLCCL